MAKLKFKNGVVEDFTIVLSTRDYRHIGQLTGIKNLHYSANLNSANEVTFSLHKADFGNYAEIKNDIWEQIVDFKLIWIKELDEYFEIRVSTTDSLEVSKTITGTALCEAELSQVHFSAEINTTEDIERDDYETTTLYNEGNPKASLLHRVLEKVPYYKVKYVDDSIKDKQRTFSISGTTIYDFLVGECAEQFHCLFLFDSSDRSISVYDLHTFGKDTTIFVDKDNLTDSIQLEGNADNVKNCFKLMAGDELMTATVRMLNPNGSDYIYYISESQRKDMPEQLKEKLIAYDALCESYNDEYEQIVNDIYRLTDDILYLESGMMPGIEQAKVTASTEAEKLNTADLSCIGLQSVSSATSQATVETALLNYAKTFVKTGYVKLEIETTTPFEYIGKDEDGWNYGTWSGRFIVTNYSDIADVAYSSEITVKVYDNYHDFINQKVLKGMLQDDEDGSIYDVLKIENLEEFQSALSDYSKNRLISFYDAIQSGLDVLIQFDQANEYADLYETLYTPYYEKLQACQAELDSRQNEIDELQTELDSAEAERVKIQNKLDFRTNLGEYYNTFLSYRREDTYSNDNYISEGLNNTELIEKAKEFIEVAKEELRKSGEQQAAISTSLYNLLVMDEFQPIVDDFELGNWIRMRVDGTLYKMYLLGYSLDFTNLQTLQVEFSNVTRARDIDYDAGQILQSAKSMATSYSYVSKQAEKGDTAQNNIEDWVKNGLNSGLVQIKNNDKEEVTYGKHGILCRAYDDIAQVYEPKQLKLTHNTIAFTDNEWQSTKTVLGEHHYKSYNTGENRWEDATNYGITTQFVTSGVIYGENQIVGGLIYSKNYSDGNTKDENGNFMSEGGSYINLDTGEFSFGGDSLYYKYNEVTKEFDFVISNSAIEKSLDEINVKGNLKIDSTNIEGTLKNDININNTFIVESDGSVTLPNSTTLPWNQITDKPTLLTETDISNQIQETVTSVYINSLENLSIENADSIKTSELYFDTSYVLNPDTNSHEIGVTGTYTIGDKSLRIVNGIIIEITEIPEGPSE